MACKNVCRLCDRLIISQAVTFAAGTLTINLPEGSYANGCKYCIVVAQAIPPETTITAPVVVTIGDGTEEYPLVGCNCAQLVACQVRTRTKYATKVVRGERRIYCYCRVCGARETVVYRSEAKKVPDSGTK